MSAMHWLQAHHKAVIVVCIESLITIVCFCPCCCQGYVAEGLDLGITFDPEDATDHRYMYLVPEMVSWWPCTR